MGDQALLERLVGNLVDNAIAHNADDEPWISFFTGEQDGVPTLRIANGGRVVAPDDVEKAVRALPPRRRRASRQ